MKNMIKLVCILGLMLTSLFGGNVASSLVTRYDITIKQLEIYNSTTASWVVLSDTITTVDIASTTAGSDIASMVSGDISISYGTYTKARVKIGNTFTIAACGSAGDDCTDGTTFVSGTHTIATAVDANAVATAGTNIIDFTTSLPAGATLSGTDALFEYDFSAPFTLNASTKSSPSINIQFDLNNVVQFVDGTNSIFVQDPTVTVNVN